MFNGFQYIINIYSNKILFPNEFAYKNDLCMFALPKIGEVAQSVRAQDS